MADYNSQYSGSQVDAAIANANSAVQYTEQTLTDSQKAQARANIGITIYNGEVI